MKHETIQECLEDALKDMHEVVANTRKQFFNNYEEECPFTDWEIISRNMFDMYRGYSEKYDIDDKGRLIAYQIFFGESGLEILTTTGLEAKYTRPQMRKMYEDSKKRTSKHYEELELNLFEYPILSQEERDYLSAVIKPFRDKVVYIRKNDYINLSVGDSERITVATSSGAGTHRYMYFPPFDKGTMYKGMETDKEYTLKELEM